MPAGTTRPFEEREAELLAELARLRRQQQLAELKEAAKGDPVARGLLSVVVAIDRALADEPDAEVEVFLRETREAVEAKIKARGVPWA